MQAEQAIRTNTTKADLYVYAQELTAEQGQPHVKNADMANFGLTLISSQC